ncbi:MAG: hypothetical protein UY21_C0023G0003 [Microgenomates group bacterium GW2011_GWA1_48_10]|nr:MAG: hypothetical protein UY21_C0023G0003 [Microgenomates group bacterium GW2011_GWA1_48_10]
MEQHPVPQHIASFEFKLFGNLTARQFITLIFPLSAATLVYFSSLPVLIRIPLTLTIGVFGLFIALVPVGGRSFDKWILAFIKAVSAPTQRVWVKEKQIPEFLSIVTTPPQKELKIPQEITEKGRERMMAYLRSLPKENVTPLDVKEQLALDRLGFPGGELGGGNLPPAILWQTNPWEDRYVAIGQGESGYLLGSLPQVNGPLEDISGFQIAPVTEPEPRPQVKREKPENTPATLTRVKIQPQAKPYTIKGIEKRLEHHPQEIIDLVRPSAHLASETNYSLDNVIPIKISASEVTMVHGVGSTRVRKLHFAPPVNFDLSKLPIRGERKFDISDELKRRFHFEDNAPDVVLPVQSKKEQAAPQPPAPVVAHPKPIPQEAKFQYSNISHTKLAPKTQTQQKEASSQDYSKFSISDKDQDKSKAAVAQQAQIIPLTDTPNVLSGLVTDEKGSPIESAVLVVRDANGIPVRALKTNKLGQFLSATPLSSGTYTIEAESDIASFKHLSVNLTGQILPPVGIRGERIN